MTEAILLAIQAVSFVVIVIIMAVMANTMAMTARERGSEYATLKALGFSGGFVARLILAESIGIALFGGARRHRAHGSARARVRRAHGHALPDLLRERGDHALPGGRRPLRRRRRRRVSGVADGVGAHRRRLAGGGVSPKGRRGRTPECEADRLSLPFGYIVRNIAARRLTTALTAGGMALVVYVFATVLMLAAGLEQTLVATGQADNVVVIRRAAQTEVQSGVDRTQAGIVESLPDIAVGRDGQKLVSKEVVVLINLPKRDSNKPSNVVIRGVTPVGVELRPQVKLVEGRMFRPGTAEVIAGRSIASRFQGAGLGETLRFASADWTVVGIYDAGRTGFDSEIWGDAEQMMQAFRRLAFSALVFKLADTGRFDAVKAGDRDPIRG